MERLKVEYLNIDELKPYKNNAKIHTAEQIEQIKNSIQKFGMIDPLGIWKDEIVEGHGRLIACKELNITEVPIIRLDHLTDEERKAYTLAHNKLTMNTDFDIDILNDELDNILNIDMSDFGFDLDMDTVSFIDDLMDNGFVGDKVEQMEFGITFQFDINKRNIIEDYIRTNGKDIIVKEIMKMIEENEDA